MSSYWFKAAQKRYEFIGSSLDSSSIYVRAQIMLCQSRANALLIERVSASSQDPSYIHSYSSRAVRRPCGCIAAESSQDPSSIYSSAQKTIHMFILSRPHGAVCVMIHISSMVTTCWAASDGHTERGRCPKFLP